jgi:hypothetical protein
MDDASLDPTVIQNIKTTVDSIPGIIRPGDHKKISRLMIFYWVFHFAATAAMIGTIAADGQMKKFNELIGTLMVILQLMITKIFESTNKQYENCMRIQSNVSDINYTILGLIRDYHDLLDRGINVNECTKERLTRLNDRIVENLEAYERNMHMLTLLVNSFFWKSPEYTPFLEKDVIRDSFVTILNDFKKDIDKLNVPRQTSGNITQHMSMDVVAF